ncbi:MAG: core-2/I-branching enzyme [Hydrococcus sp. Prado102]|jgi:hypothetical protein|nr:core-2/I-branching enzyme [Hydrococcus sp. Prado102]
MKICYFIQTHKNPEQIYRLVRTIKRSSPTAGIVIGHDFTSCSLDITPLQDLEDIHLLKIEFRAIRGDFSLLQPYLMAIDWLVETKFEFDWLVYLSGQDYLTQASSDFETFLATTDYDGFIRYWDVFSPQSPWRKEKALRRYYYQYYRLPDSMQVVLESISKIIKSLKLEKVVPMQFFLTYGSLIGFQSRSHPFNENFKCYGGSQWHTLSRRCFEYLREFIKNHPELVIYYKKTVVPDESFVQSILVNSQKFNLCNDNKQYFDNHQQPGGHARILTTEDYVTLINGNFYFARKFDLERNSQILDQLDAKIFQNC